MSARPHRLVWLEIPARDHARAVRFYEELLGVTLRHEELGPMRVSVFPYEEPNVSGCVMSGPGLVPSPDGPRAYLSCDAAPGGLDGALQRAGRRGARLVVPRTELPPGMGVFAVVEDTEGNHVGLHQR